MVRRKKRGTDKRKYYALMLGAMLVALFAGSSVLQSTYAIGEGWSLNMSVASIKIGADTVWPSTDYIRVEGSDAEGYDLVSVTSDEVGPIDPYGVTKKPEATGKPALVVSLGSFTQPATPVPDESVPGEKTYRWVFSGYVYLQTISASATVDSYTIDMITDSAPSTEIAELGTLDLEVIFDFDLVAGENAKGSCMFETTDIVDVVSEHEMINSFGVASEYLYADSLKIPTVDTLITDTNGILTEGISLVVDGEFASGAEVQEGEMDVYTAYAEFPLNFVVIQTVSEFDDARFNIPESLSSLPLTFEELFAENVLGPNLIMFVIIPLVLVGVCYGGSRWAYGSAGKSMPSLGKAPGGSPPTR